MKGFVGIPIILILMIVFSGGGMVYMVAKNLTETIVSPIPNFGYFDETGEDDLRDSLVSPMPEVTVDHNIAYNILNKKRLLKHSGFYESSGSSTVAGISDVQASNLEVVLESVDPASGKAGDLITLKGSGFGSSQGAIYFKSNIDDSCCSVQADYWSDNEIKVVVEAAGIRGEISVAVETASGFFSNYIDFEVKSGLPVIEKVEPEEVVAGQFIAIYGKEFGDEVGNVNFYESTGGIAGECIFGAGFVWNNAQISCIVPEELLTGEYYIEVVTPEGEESDIKQLTIDN